MLTKKDFLNLRNRNRDEDIWLFDSIVIIPTRKIHSSWYRIIQVIAMDDNIPLCIISCCSDVISLWWIGSKDNWEWRIDLMRCGYFRIFWNKKITCWKALSLFEVFNY